MFIPHFLYLFTCPLEKDMATHSSVLAWRIPGTGEPGGLPSVGSHRVRYDSGDLAAAAGLFWGLAWLPTHLPHCPALPLPLPSVSPCSASHDQPWLVVNSEERLHLIYLIWFLAVWPSLQNLTSWPGIELSSWQWKHRVPTTRPPGNSPIQFVKVHLQLLQNIGYYCPCCTTHPWAYLTPIVFTSQSSTLVVPPATGNH